MIIIIHIIYIYIKININVLLHWPIWGNWQIKLKQSQLLKHMINPSLSSTCMNIFYWTIYHVPLLQPISTANRSRWKETTSLCQFLTPLDTKTKPFWLNILASMHYKCDDSWCLCGIYIFLPFWSKRIYWRINLSELSLDFFVPTFFNPCS